jgi:hypothetical protein
MSTDGIVRLMRAVDADRTATPPLGLPIDPVEGGDAVRRGGFGAAMAITASATATASMVWWGIAGVAGDRNASWILGRASGVTSYLLMVALVGLGLVLSHPRSARWRRPSRTARIRAHVSLAVFTLVFLALHVVVLATDAWAKVGWWGALVPMASQYRPVPVTLGVVAVYAGLVTGITASLAGRVFRRIWWPVHKVAAVILVLAWAHGLLAGSDSAALSALYLVTGAGVAVLAGWRYLARTPADELAGMRSRAGARAASRTAAR